MSISDTAGAGGGDQRIRVRLEDSDNLELQPVFGSLLHIFTVAAHIRPGAVVVLLIQFRSSEHAEFHAHKIVVGERKVAGVQVEAFAGHNVRHHSLKLALIAQSQGVQRDIGYFIAVGYQYNDLVVGLRKPSGKHLVLRFQHVAAQQLMECVVAAHGAAAHQGGISAGHLADIIRHRLSHHRGHDR